MARTKVFIWNPCSFGFQEILAAAHIILGEFAFISQPCSPPKSSMESGRTTSRRPFVLEEAICRLHVRLGDVPGEGFSWVMNPLV